MNRMIWIVLLSATACLGQVSPEEAQARLAARQHATTEPVQELADLRQIVVELRKENAELKARVSELTAELKSRPEAPPVKNSTVVRALPEDTNYASIDFHGLTPEQAAVAAGSKFYPVGSVDDTQIFQANIYLSIQAGTSRHWEIRLYVKDGKVSHSEVQRLQERARTMTDFPRRY